jgi:peroxiredoxin family protein
VLVGTGDDIDAIQASLLRAMASPQRLRIVHLLGVAPREVNELARELGTGQAAMSQHLAAMRAVGLVDATREGRTVRYRLSDPEILEACGLMRGARPATRAPRRPRRDGGARRRRRDPRAHRRSLVSDSLSIVLFSGTEDKLHAAATLAVGAVAMDRPVNVLLMYWALDAFRADRIANDHGLAYDAARPRFNEPVERVGAIPWLETFRQAKEIGEMTILACSGSLEVLGIDVTTLDPLVDSSGGIATFLMAAEGGQVLFI